MGDLAWIIAGGLIMSAVAMVGSVSTMLRPATLDRLLLPIVALAAGTLLGGAFFHMIPEGMASLGALDAGIWLVAGFTVFLALEQFLHWHQTHRATSVSRTPVTYLVLIGDAIHNFVGGLGIASTFLINPQAGVIAWFAAVAHEVPQELGDFGILLRGGWPRGQALAWNLVSALTFPLGALVAYEASKQLDVSSLVMFGAGNFIYIAASDLVPEIRTRLEPGRAVLHFGCFLAGLAITLALACYQH